MAAEDAGGDEAVSITSNPACPRSPTPPNQTAVLIGDLGQKLILPGRLLASRRKLQENVQMLAERRSLLVLGAAAMLGTLVAVVVWVSVFR